MTSYWVTTSRIFTRRAQVTRLDRGLYKVSLVEVDLKASAPFATYREVGVRWATSKKSARVIANDYINTGKVVNKQLELPGMPARTSYYD